MSTEAERDKATRRQAAINEALAVSDACWRMEQEVLQRQLAEWRSRAEYAERELSAALDLPPSVGPTEGEAKRIVETLRRERDEARSELKKTEDDFQSVFDSRDEVIRERERARQACNTYWHDLTRIALLCAQTDDEYPLKAVERTVRERDEARTETQQLIELNRSHVATLCEAQRNQVEALKAENERLQRLLDHATQPNPGTSVLVMLMNEAREARAETERLRAERDSFYEGQKGALAEFSRREVHQRAYNAAFDREIERGKSPAEAADLAGRVAYWDVKESEAKGEP